jgi:hypothetical protein
MKPTTPTAASSASSAAPTASSALSAAFVPRPAKRIAPWIAPWIASLALVALVSGCVNKSRIPSRNKSTSNTGTTDGTTGLTDNFVIGNVTIGTAPTGNSTAGPPVTIFFDSARSTSASGEGAPLISQHCTKTDSGNSAKPCFCQYTWTEVNSTGSTRQEVTRRIQQPVSNVQQQLIACSGPSSTVFNNEIDNGTSVRLTVLAGSGNPDAGLFTVGTHTFVKNTLTTGGSFQDAQGHAFDNIVHYSCYEQFKIGSVIQSKFDRKQDTVNGSPTFGSELVYPRANSFCLQAGTGNSNGIECPNLPSAKSNSSQAYYYNFFIRVSQAGSVNQWNDRFTCPAIKEPIYNGGGVGTQSNVYPMDSTFALSQGPTPSFNVGVNAFVELSNGGADPISVNAKTCDGQSVPGNSATDGFVQACLGFAAKPEKDGTCPSIRDSTGATRFTYRLRRFIALYPPLFETDGKAPRTRQRSNTIYVLDRPVTPPSGSNPLKPYTMRGPKPCPFALFDSKGVLGFTDAAYPNQKLPIYGATNNPGWNGTNVDGIQLPNFDSPNSCSAAIPLVKTDPLNPELNVVSIGTVNRNNPALPNVFIRPTQAWAPHYEEDLSFQACAPQATPLRDPPLHFARDNTTGNVSWCAEVYPSQNEAITSLDQLTNPNLPLSASNPYIGHVRPFTSHVAKNSRSADCIASIPTTIPTGGRYPAASVTGTSCNPVASPAAIARHPADALVDTKNNYLPDGTPAGTTNVCAGRTCDRTAIITGGLGFQQFPLLATAPQVEQAISADTTYGCVLTFDGGGPKTGKLTPTGGCCGANVTMTSGIGATTPGLINRNAHLEPDVPCLTPQY